MSSGGRCLPRAPRNIVAAIGLNKFNIGTAITAAVHEQSTEWPFQRSFRVIEPAACLVIISNWHQGLGVGDCLLIFDALAADFFKNH